MQTLPQSVRADDQVVEGQPQFDDRVPADEAPLPRRHLLAEHAAVADAEEVYQSVGGDRLGTEGGSPVECGPLLVQQRPQPGERLGLVSFGGRQAWTGHCFNFGLRIWDRGLSNLSSNPRSEIRNPKSSRRGTVR